MTSFPLPQPGAVRPTRVFSLEYYSEGPVIDLEGNLYISHGTSISRMTPGGDLTTWAASAAPNGHKILANGEHLVCDSTQHGVLRFDPEGRPLGRAAGGRCQDLEIVAPNDLCLHPGAGILFHRLPAQEGRRHLRGPGGKTDRGGQGPGHSQRHCAVCRR